MENPKDWVVRVYDKRGRQIASWSIENRTEHEAEREAMADVTRDYGHDADWTMTNAKADSVVNDGAPDL